MQKLCSKYGFVYSPFFSYNKIKSKFGTWYYKQLPNGYIKLYHENKFYFSRNQKGIYHYQTTLENIPHMLSYINAHDRKYITTSKRTIIAKNKFQLIKQ